MTYLDWLDEQIERATKESKLAQDKWESGKYTGYLEIEMHRWNAKRWALEDAKYNYIKIKNREDK